MSIEGGGVTTRHKTVTGAESPGVRGNAGAKSTGEADDDKGGGFLALLMSLEPDTALGVGGAEAPYQIAGVAPQLLAGIEPQAALSPSSDPPVVVVQNLPNELAMLLGQAGLGMGRAGAPEQIASVAPPLLTGVPSQAVVLPSSDPPAAMAQNWPNVPPNVPPMGIEKPGGAMTPSDFFITEESGDLGGRVDPTQGQAAQLLPIRLSKGGGAEFQSRAGASLAALRSLHFSPHMDVAAREPAMSGALVSSGLGESLLRPADRPMARSLVPQGASGIEGLWGQPGSLPGHGVDAPAATADPSMLSFESTLAETVSYWATQGVQNAELTLDGPGGETVEVRISVKGEDAQIDFRTDQPEIRRVLEGAAAHLKDILASEGLVLSGVSVGSSGQEGAGAQEQRNRQGARRATLVMSGVAPAEATPRVVPSIARAIDIFV